jgi:Ras-related GTP-binding protein C/D
VVCARFFNYEGVRASVDTSPADVQQDLFNRIRDELNDLADMEFATSSDYVFPVINYHFTSIYQASVYDALSKVVSRLMPCQGALERLLDMLVQASAEPAGEL